MSFGRLYPEDGSFPITLSEDIREAIRYQVHDNQGAMYAAVQALSLQIRSHAIDRRALLSFLSEMPVPTTTITDNFDISTQELMSIRSTDPISIVSCLNCRTHLPDSDRRTLLSHIRTLKHLERFEEEDPVERETLYTLLCEGCAQEARRLHHEQVRAERLTRHARKNQLRKMASKNLSEYRKTPEWRVLRSRKLIMAGNRCQVCSTTAKPLDCHHNSYERLGDELLEDLVILCRTCHQLYHDILPKAA